MALRPALAPLVLVMSASIASSGCSYIFSKGPPDDHRRLRYFDCSTSYAPPVLDTIWAGLNGLGALNAASSSDAEWTSTYSRGATMAVGLVWLMLSGSSAFYGYSQVSSCNEARNQMIMRMNNRYPNEPRSWPPPPPRSFPPPAPAPADPPPEAPPAPQPAPPSAPETPTGPPD